jgi:hypothetical protein
MNAFWRSDKAGIAYARCHLKKMVREEDSNKRPNMLFIKGL